MITSTEIIENEEGLMIITPNRKSWLLIICLSVLTFQCLTVVLLNLIQISSFAEILRIILFGSSAYVFTLGLLWQLKGEKIIKVLENKLVVSKSSPLLSKSRTYDLEKIKGFEAKDVSVSEGPMAMLQLLGIADKTKLSFAYEDDIVETISGTSLVEAEAIKSKIEARIRKNQLRLTKCSRERQ